MGIPCGKCGAVNPEGAAFCKKCGSRLGRTDTTRFSDVSPSFTGIGHTEQGGFSGNLRVLDSDEPYPDKAGKYKALNFFVFIAGNIVAWSFGSGLDLAQKLVNGLIAGAVLAGACHLFLVNIIANMISLPLNYYKYWLPQPMTDGELARKIAVPLKQMDLRVRLNSGITGGIFIGDDNIAYQVILHNDKRYFEVLSTGRVYLSTYECLIRDIPRIAYTIQQKLL